MTDPASTRDLLVHAAVAVVGDVGPAAATTKAIATRAGLNEVTLFRHFGSKAALLSAAVTTVTGPFLAAQEEAPTPEGRLVALASRYVRAVDEHAGFVAHMLAYSRTDDEIGRAIRGVQRALVSQVGVILDDAGLKDESTADAITTFVGPLLARALFIPPLSVARFDADAYVDLYLRGHRAPTSRATRA